MDNTDFPKKYLSVRLFISRLPKFLPIFAYVCLYFCLNSVVYSIGKWNSRPLAIFSISPGTISIMFWKGVRPSVGRSVGQSLFPTNLNNSICSVCILCSYSVYMLCSYSICSVCETNTVHGVLYVPLTSCIFYDRVRTACAMTVSCL